VRERILQLSEELFWRYGVKSVTMDDIARELGISKKTIYQHFPDKDAIIEEVISHKLNCEKVEIENMEGQSKNAVDEIMLALKNMKVLIGTMNPLLLFELRKYHTKAWQLFQGHKYDHLKNSISRNMEWGIMDGLYLEDINIEALTRLRLEEVELAMDPVTFPPDRFSMIDLQINFLHHFLRGILSPKGFQLYNQYLKEQSAITSNNQ
jgi:AcrR family transcriptional regulator